jgi:hypothetical protein
MSCTSGCTDRSQSACGVVPGCALPVDVTSDSNPFDSSVAFGHAISLLPAWGGLAYSASYPPYLSHLEGSCSSASIMQSKLQWRHKISPTGTYKVKWTVRTIPDGGGATSDTSFEYNWDGVIPSGYDPTNDATWPVSGTYEVDQPSVNGSTVLQSLSVDCGQGPVVVI